MRSRQKPARATCKITRYDIPDGTRTSSTAKLGEPFREPVERSRNFNGLVSVDGISATTNLFSSLVVWSSQIVPICRGSMSTEKLYKPSSIQSRAPHPIISSLGPPRHQLIATSVKDYCGALHVKVFAALNVVLSAMKNAKICSMRIVSSVGISD